MDWLDIIRNLGFPAAFCLAAGLGSWKVARWLGPRAEKWIERLVTSHEDLTRSCIEIGRSNSSTLKNLEVIAVAQTNTLGKIFTEVARRNGPPPNNDP